MVFKFCIHVQDQLPWFRRCSYCDIPRTTWQISSKQMTIQTIGHDKLNQLRHVRFFKDHPRHGSSICESMPISCDRSLKRLNRHWRDELGGLEIGTWTKPQGGYFISFDALEGCAKAIVAKAKEAGVVMTGAGATFPYGKDPTGQQYPYRTILSDSWKSWLWLRSFLHFASSLSVLRRFLRANRCALNGCRLIKR